MADHDGWFKKDHAYGKNPSNERIPGYQIIADRTGPDHSYAKTKRDTPVKNKRKRQVSTPTGTTPLQPTKILDESIKRPSWSAEEKQLLKELSMRTRAAGESEMKFWEQCAAVLNEKYPDKKRTGNSCKSASRRLCLFDPGLDVTVDTSISQDSVMKDVSCQTDWSIAATLTKSEPKEGDWIFMEPKKSIQSTVDGAQNLHEMALKRLRRYSDLKPDDRVQLIKALFTSSARDIAMKIMSSPLRGEILLEFLYDIEHNASECCNKGNILSDKDFNSLCNFKWSDVLNSLISEQPLLAEVLLTVALPTGKIGNTKATESVLPMICSVYGMLMKQRYQELSLIQKVVAITLANEQTNQKVIEVEVLFVWFLFMFIC